MIYFFVPEIFKFSYYANFATDDVIGCTSTVVWHKLRISPPIRKQCYWNLLLINSIHSNVKNSKKDWGTFNALCSERNVKKLIILYPIAHNSPCFPTKFCIILYSEMLLRICTPPKSISEVFCHRVPVHKNSRWTNSRNERSTMVISSL